MSFSIYYNPEAYSIDRPNLMGRHMAGFSFLNGYIHNSRYDSVSLMLDSAKDVESIDSILKKNNSQKKINFIAPYDYLNLRNRGLFYPGPDIAKLASNRSFYGNNMWSLCGITHTTSSAEAIDSILNILTTPVQTWDALICTSTAVKNNVIRVLQSHLDFLQSRLGLNSVVLPTMPVIPLGINVKDFNFDDRQRTLARAKLDINEDEIAILYVGRLSFHAKAHPLPMYQALENAFHITGKKLVLIECGWHANELIKKSFVEAAKFSCPNVRLISVDGRESDMRQVAWASGDIFCSLSDNIQETFGITPIEAMASGMPLVVSDWNGYKDTVRDRIDGFRVPTLMPESGLGIDLALRYAIGVDSYDMYCGHASSLIVIDIISATNSFVELIKSPSLRKSMGESAKARAQKVYDWSVVVKQYEDLWSLLNEKRKSAEGQQISNNHLCSSRMDPFESFAEYPTISLSLNTKFRLPMDRARTKNKLINILKLSSINYASAIIPSNEEIEIILSTASMNPMKAEEIIKFIDDQRKSVALRSLGWFAKFGLLEVVL